VVGQNHSLMTNNVPTTIEDMMKWLQSLYTDGKAPYPDTLQEAIYNCIYRSIDPGTSFYLAHRDNNGERVLEKHSDLSLRKCLHDLGEINYFDLKKSTIDNIIRQHDMKKHMKIGGHDINNVWREAFQ
jgi:hypothetical protein